MYKLPNDYSNFHFLSPHDRLYKDCLKNVQWEKDYITVDSILDVFSLILFVTFVIGLLLY
ncbi:hypothetical protein UFOVP22_39 [uncultured Caudovirales phage]|uniref:Uncharacterized protein n=1 Tax=uncultured Caudovirales phage TaxID=2100421 RepID=A0A6J5T8X3_9CAUD|nr:hypothetical protein UFOVP22_39 [uncultured Caudovirales phage]